MAPRRGIINSMTNLLKSDWADFDPAELRLILLQYIGKPGQYSGREQDPNTFYLPLTGTSCQVKLTFSDEKKIIAIETGPAFDNERWERVEEEVEKEGPPKVGREVSFSSFRVEGSWHGEQSGVQILPPPPGAPLAPYESGEHPFIIEYPFKISVNELWPITNFRRMRMHRQVTFLLNTLLKGYTTLQPRRSRHFWATVKDDSSDPDIRWVQEFYFTKFGKIVQDELSSPIGESLEEVEPEAYYASVGHDGRALRMPADLDDSICCYLALTKENRNKFDRAGFWTQMASRQWTTSLSAAFASLAIAIESLSESGHTRRAEKFRNFIEQNAPGASLESRRQGMYGLRSDILHGSSLFEMDQDTDFGWSPPEEKEKELLQELWGLTRIAMRNWLKTPQPS